MLKYYNQKLKGIKGVLPDIRGFSRTSDDGQLQSVIGIDNILIYGNSIQDGTPSPDNPVEIQGVGDKTSNLFDIRSLGRLVNPDGSITITGYPQYTAPLGSLCPDLKSGDKFKFSFITDGYGMLYINGNYFTKNTEYIATDVLLSKIVGFYRKTSAQGGGAATISNIQFWKTSEYASKPPYCPYGEHYIIPITVGSKTTNIYLDEPLRKIGGISDYIDWKSKKVYYPASPLVHTDDVDLPDLKSIIPQYDRDYTLSVGTAVTQQLSIKYRSNYQEEV